MCCLFVMPQNAARVKRLTPQRPHCVQGYGENAVDNAGSSIKDAMRSPCQPLDLRTSLYFRYLY